MEQSLELVGGELPLVERIGWRLVRCTDPRRRNEERPAGPEYPPHLGEKALLVAQVLDRLERADDVERGVGPIKCEQVADCKLDVRPAVAAPSVRDRLLALVDADDTGRGLREERRAVAHTAARVQDMHPVAPRPGELVALEMERDNARLGLVRHDPLRWAHRILTAPNYPYSLCGTAFAASASSTRFRRPLSV